MSITRRRTAVLATTVAALTRGGVASAAPKGDKIDLLCDGLPSGAREPLPPR